MQQDHRRPRLTQLSEKPTRHPQPGVGIMLPGVMKKAQPTFRFKSMTSCRMKKAQPTFHLVGMIAMLLAVPGTAAAVDPAQSTQPTQVGWVTSLLEPIPPEHRVWALGILALFAAWVVHIRFGRDPVARAQRRAMLTAEERETLDAAVERRRRAAAIADEMRRERGGRS